MNWILKNKKKNAKALFIVLFLVFGFLFFVSNNVKAAEVCENGTGNERSCECFEGNKSLQLFPAGTDLGNGEKGFCLQEACMTFCKSKYPLATAVKFDGGSLFGGTSSMKNSSSAVDKAPTISEAFGGIFTAGVKFILTQIQLLVGWLFAIAATLFAWAIDPSNMSGDTGLLNKPAVRDVWTMVRDLLNMTFILVLLFAAFCTIFQVDKWALKKVWLNILINALLVNFSYPIARFFIDVSNVAFYYFVNHLFSSTGAVTGSSIMAMFGASSTIGNLLQPASFTADPIAYQIAMIVFIFIMGMTLLIVAGLFLIRLIALTMLVMFSPIGFVGYIFPDTAKHADKWWSQLFAYSFFAPIMIFGIAISLRIAEALKAENIRSMISNASTNAPADQIQWVSDMAFYFIPVIILWMFIGVAKSAGIAGADTVVGGVKKGGKWLANAPGKYSGIYGATKKATEDFNKKGKLFGKKIPLMGSAGREEREAAMAAFVTGGTGGYKDARRNVEDKKIAEQMKEYKDRNYTSDIIAKDLDSKDSHKRQAAVKALISDKTSLGDPAILEKVLQNTGNNNELRHKAIDASDFADNDKTDHHKLNLVLTAATQGMSTADAAAMTGKIKGKVRKENAKKLLEHEKAYNRNGRSNTDIYEEELNKLNPESFGKQKKLHEDIGVDVALKAYAKKHYANPSNKAAHVEAYSKMTNKARAAWASDPTLVP